MSEIERDEQSEGDLGSRGGPAAADGAISLLELLATLGGAELRSRWSDATLVVAWVGLSGGRSALFVERTYREGIRILLDPTQAELDAAREGRLWDLWNSDRADLLAGAI